MRGSSLSPMVIRQHVAARIHCSITKESYEGIKHLLARGPVKIDDPYLVCFFGLLQTVAYHHKRLDIRTPVDFIFDENGTIGNHAAKFYDVFQIIAGQKGQTQAFYGATPVFRDDKIFLPLQAADLYAYEMRWYARYGQQLKIAASPVIRALAEVPSFGLELTARDMHEVHRRKEFADVLRAAQSRR